MRPWSPNTKSTGQPGNWTPAAPIDRTGLCALCLNQLSHCGIVVVVVVVVPFCKHKSYATIPRESNTRHSTFADNYAKCWPIFKILSATRDNPGSFDSPGRYRWWTRRWRWWSLAMRQTSLCRGRLTFRQSYLLTNLVLATTRRTTTATTSAASSPKVHHSSRYQSGPYPHTLYLTQYKATLLRTNKAVYCS